MALEAKVKLTLVDKVTKKLDSIYNNISRTNTLANKTGKIMDYWPKILQESINKAKKLKDEFKKNNTLVDDMGRKLKSIFAAYGGVMTIRAVVEVTDTITQAENQLNYSNGGYASKTEETKDKIYAAAMRSRGSYADMLEGVGNDLVLAMDKFGSEDNAIKFEETMQKAFAISGSPIEAINSSMYQLRQGIASGKLQGDEMKSVAKGATLAYTKMEEYVQGVLRAKEAEQGLSEGTLGSTKSLRELGSEGVISGEMVVAAVLSSSEAIDEAFEDTQMKLSDVATKINNVWTKSFDSIQDTISEFLNSDKGEKFVNGITIAVQGLVGVIGVLVNVAVNSATWIVDNWYWVQWIVYAVGIAVIWFAAVAIGKMLVTAFLKVAATGALAWLPWLFGISLVVAGIVYLAKTAKDGCDFIYKVCYALVWAIIGVLAIVLVVYLATGAVMLSVPLLIALAIIAVVALVVMAIAKYGEEIGAFIAGLASVIWNIFVTLVAAIIQNAIRPFATAWDVVANFLGNIFNDPIAAIIHTFETLANSVLGILKTIASGIDAIFGSNLAATVQGWMNGVSGKANELANKYGNGTYETKSNAVGALNDIMSGAVDKFTWDTSLAVSQGASVGASVQGGINNAFDKVKNGISGFGGSFDPNGLKDLAITADNTDKIADSMDLTTEDLEYLRRIADMEWKKEFTTANIVVDMKNNNTINNQGDLDGWVTLLTDKLYEELDYVANGVYA